MNPPQSAGRWVFPLLALVMMMGGRAAAQASAEKPQVPRVLLLYENDRLLPANMRVDEGFRWGIAESRLPQDAIVLFRQPGLWETHRTAVLVALGVIAVQGALIAMLLAARRRARDVDASLSLAADAANIGLWHRDPAGQDLTASPKWRAIFGFPNAGRVPLQDVMARIHADDRQRALSAIDDAASAGRSFAMEHRVVHPDGGVRWVASHGRAEAGHGTGNFETRGASMDITDRKEAELASEAQRQELAHLSRISSLGVLSGALAHELNQPLGIILSNAQAAQHLLTHPRPDMQELHDILTDIVMEDRRAGDVIKRLRALLRRGETTPQRVAVNASIDDVLLLTRSDLVSRGITVQREFSKHDPQVVADRVQLQQVMLNLIMNARDAMDGNEVGERIMTLATSADGDEVQIAVRDCGMGLPGDIESLFKPFHTTKAHGLGMGLAICRTLIGAHGGRLWAERNADRGATFHVALPKVKENA